MTAQEIATKLTPLGCNATPAGPSTVSVGEIMPAMSLECMISGESVLINEYLGAHETWYGSELPRPAGCSTKGWGAPGFLYVVGPKWLVVAKTGSTTMAIAKAIGSRSVFGSEC
jgi:hypothetical protein